MSRQLNLERIGKQFIKALLAQQTKRFSTLHRSVSDGMPVTYLCCTFRTPIKGENIYASAKRFMRKIHVLDNTHIIFCKLYLEPILNGLVVTKDNISVRLVTDYDIERHWALLRIDLAFRLRKEIINGKTKV